MAPADIPKRVRRFISEYIDSVAELEALLLLRAAPEETWDTVRVAARLYTNEPEAARILGRLCRNGLLTCTGTVYRYECRTEKLRRMVDDVAELYSRYLIPITNMIHAKSRRIREFADAFRFRKDS